jgi:ASC-1-like (ASCH) protein
MSKITMRLHPEPYHAIKKVECRLNDEKRQLLKVGDEIVFELRPDSVESIEKTIVALHTFTNFEEMFEQFPEERINDVYQYYSLEEERKFGVVAIELQ